jgi:hypothetical protein
MRHAQHARKRNTSAKRQNTNSTQQRTRSSLGCGTLVLRLERKDRKVADSAHLTRVGKLIERGVVALQQSGICTQTEHGGMLHDNRESSGNETGASAEPHHQNLCQRKNYGTRAGKKPGTTYTERTTRVLLDEQTTLCAWCTLASKTR